MFSNLGWGLMVSGHFFMGILSNLGWKAFLQREFAVAHATSVCNEFWVSSCPFLPWGFLRPYKVN